MTNEKSLPGRYRVRPSQREGINITLPLGGSASQGRGGGIADSFQNMSPTPLHLSPRSTFMSGPAQVRSVDAIERFRVALVEFEHRATNALDELTAQVRRATDWLDHDCPAHWVKQEKTAADAVHQAKLDLERCLIFPIAGEKPACREERATLKAAKDRLDYCREKRQLVRHWRGILLHEVFEYLGRIGHLRRLLETELPTARAKLELIVRRVEGYTIERPPDSMETLPWKPTSFTPTPNPTEPTS
jgi:hypothetical protein